MMSQVSGSRRRGRPAAGTAIDPAVLLAKALAAFAERGYEGVSVRQLARDLGISHALLNARFGAKRELWFAAMNHALTALEQELLAAVRSEDAEDDDDLAALREGIVAYVTFAAAHPEVLRIMRYEGAIDSERLRFVADRFVASVKAISEGRLERLAAAGRIRPISYAAFHYLVGHGGGGPFASAAEASLIGAGPPRGAAAIRAHAEQVADVIIRGITA
jgi:TetR/AcrR family transcriptional regulator